MTGLIGFSSGYYAMLDCDILLMLGTDFRIANSTPRRGGAHCAGGRAARTDRPSRAVDIAWWATSAPALKACCRSSRKRANAPTSTGNGTLPQGTQGPRWARGQQTGRKPIHPQQVAKAISDQASQDAIFTCDVGLPTCGRALPGDDASAG